MTRPSDADLMNVTLLEAGHGECRWPVGIDDRSRHGPDMAVCGAPVVDAFAGHGRLATHCAHHLALSCGSGSASERNAARTLEKLGLDRRVG